MQTEILNTYARHRTAQDGRAYEPSAHDHEVAKLAASASEADLRQAVLMRGTYERAQRAKAVLA